MANEEKSQSMFDEEERCLRPKLRSIKTWPPLYSDTFEAPAAKKKKGKNRKGDIAPSSYRLMSVKNVAQANITFFESSPFSFVQNSLRIYNSAHYDPAKLSKEHLWYAARSFEVEHTPNSARYRKLVGEMEGRGLCRKFVPNNQNPDEYVIIFSLFAVVKDDVDKTARPISNERPGKTRDKPSFNLAGAKQLVQQLRAKHSEGCGILHFDLSNCYFQYGNPFPYQHGFRCDDVVYVWAVLTMGYDFATNIAQSFTYDITCRGAPNLPATLLSQVQPPGMVQIAKNGALICCVYDSVMIVDKLQMLESWETRIQENRKHAHIALKYLEIQRVGSTCEYCGFELAVSANGVAWRIGKSTFTTWYTISKEPMCFTLKTIWRLLGYLTFAYTILELPFRWLGYGRSFQSQCGLIKDDEWNIHNISLAPLIARLCQTIQQLDNTHFRHRKSQKRPREEDICRVVFDATMERWAFIVIAEDGSPIFKSSGFTNLTKDGPQRVSQELAEAIACAEAISYSTREFSHCTTFVVIGDNIGVTWCFNRGYSSSPKVDDEIKRSGVGAMLQTVVMVDVKSEENFADIVSRPNEVYTVDETLFRKLATAERARVGLYEFNMTGMTFVSRQCVAELEKQDEVVEPVLEIG